MSGQETSGQTSDVAPLFYVDKMTGEPCPTKLGVGGQHILCDRTDWRTHRHVDGRQRNYPPASPATNEADQ